jgi:hypothetical protein
MRSCASALERGGRVVGANFCFSGRADCAGVSNRASWAARHRASRWATTGTINMKPVTLDNFLGAILIATTAEVAFFFLSLGILCGGCSSGVHLGFWGYAILGCHSLFLLAVWLHPLPGNLVLSMFVCAGWLQCFVMSLAAIAICRKLAKKWLSSTFASADAASAASLHLAHGWRRAAERHVRHS